MDTRYTAEQAELQRSAGQLLADLGPKTVVDLDDTDRVARLAKAVHEAGWLELRCDAGDGAPLASGVEAAIVAQAMGSAVADVAFVGPLLAHDLARRCGVTLSLSRDVTIAFNRSLDGVAIAQSATTLSPMSIISCAVTFWPGRARCMPSIVRWRQLHCCWSKMVSAGSSVK